MTNMRMFLNDKGDDGWNAIVGRVSFYILNVYDNTCLLLLLQVVALSLCVLDTAESGSWAVGCLSVCQSELMAFNWSRLILRGLRLFIYLTAECVACWSVCLSLVRILCVPYVVCVFVWLCLMCFNYCLQLMTNN